MLDVVRVQIVVVEATIPHEEERIARDVICIRSKLLLIFHATLQILFECFAVES